MAPGGGFNLEFRAKAFQQKQWKQALFSELEFF
jgi:hypothetical protein